MSEVIIRLCERDDLSDVVKLMNELREVAQGDEIAFRDVNKIFTEMEPRPELYLNVVAEISGKVVGFISAIFYRTVFHKGGTALINELIITQAERRKGIGKRLVQMVQEEALKRGFDEVEVGTERANEGAQGFYRRCGFNEEYVLLGMEFE